jgi:formylmethanofuran dehydrogenase subunit D
MAGMTHINLFMGKSHKSLKGFMRSVSMLLVTGRTTRQGIASEIGKTGEEYSKNTAVVFLTKNDMKTCSLESGDHVVLKTSFGSVVVRCEEGRWGRDGIAFIPYGPWANLLCGSDTQGTGMPDYKGIEVTVERTLESPPTQERIARLLRGMQ